MTAESTPDKYQIVKKAHAIAIRNRDDAELTREERFKAATELAQAGVFSNTQIALFTGIRPNDVGRISGKRDHTGGSITIESLPLVLTVIDNHRRGEVSFKAVLDAVEAGCKTPMLSRLTGIPSRTLSRHARRAAGLE
jgi:hypothetical protein